MMGPLTPFVMRCEYQTYKAQAVWAFHSQAAFCLPSRLGFRALKSHPLWLNRSVLVLRCKVGEEVKDMV